MADRTAVDRRGEGLRTTSLRGRVVRSSMLVLALVLLGLGVFVDLTLANRLRADLTDRLVDRAGLVSQLSAVGVAGQDLVERTSGNGVSVQVTASDGTSVGALAATPPKPAAGPGKPGPPGKAAAASYTASDVQESSDGNLLYVTLDLADDQRALLSADPGEIRDVMTRLVVVELIGAAIALLLAALVLRRTAGAALSPLDRVTATARSITAGDRGRRLRPDRTDTELGRTATAFDEMLDQLEGAERKATASAAKSQAAENAMRTLLADAAHELRTPLAVVKAHAERLLRRDPGREAREQAMAAMVAEVDRANALVDGVLTLRRLEAGLPDADHRVDLAAVARDEVERVRARRPGVAITVTAGEADATGSAPYLGQAVANLLDNATRVAAHVTVDVGREGATAYVDVRDDGPGVPDDQRERVFERLVRLDTARTRTSGAGLGLPIAREIARAHGGDLVCLPTDRGAWFRLTVPDADLTQALPQP